MNTGCGVMVVFSNKHEDFMVLTNGDFHCGSLCFPMLFSMVWGRTPNGPFREDDVR